MWQQEDRLRLPMTYRVVNSANLGSVKVLSRSCPMCGRDNDDQPALKTSFDVWNIKECLDCRFVYIDTAPNYEQLLSELGWEHTTQIEAKRRSEIRPVGFKVSKMSRARLHLLPRKDVSQMVARKAESGAILDLGCGDGLYVARMPEQFTPYGIEISTAIAEVASANLAQRGGHCVNAPALEGLQSLPDNKFTGAILRSYLEHELNPLPTLQELYRVLKPGGVAVVKVPNYGSWNRKVQGAKWCGFRYPDHLNYFTPNTLKAMGELAGFQVKHGLTYNLPTSDNMYADLIKPN